MNRKELLLNEIVNNVVKCCSTTIDEFGTMSLTREDVLGKSRSENVVMTRAILVNQILSAGYSVTTIAQLLNRTPNAVRHLHELGSQLERTSLAYQIALKEAKELNSQIKTK